MTYEYCCIFIIKLHWRWNRAIQTSRTRMVRWGGACRNSRRR